MAVERLRRYYFADIAIERLDRYLSAGVVISSLVLAAAVSSLIWSPILLLFAVGGAYGLVRPAQPQWHVEVGRDFLVVSMLTARRIAYRDIASADFHVYNQPQLVRAVAKASIAFGRLFGGRSPMIGRSGDTNKDVVHVKFARTLWSYLPFPPFLIPARSAWLRVDDAAGLRSDIRRRLRSSGSGSTH